MMRALQNKLPVVAALAVAFLLHVQSGISQTIDAAADMAFFESQMSTQSHFHKRDYLFKDEKSLLVKYNPLSLSLGGLMYLYQNAISQQLSASCMYQPTCSEFGKRSIARYGIFKGIFLSADRVTRCNKIAGLDVHPLTIDAKTHKSKDPITLYE